MKKYFSHRTALVESKHIGDESRIWAYVHILKGAKIGRNANVCDHCFIENKVIIGSNVTIKSGVYLWDGIQIDDDVMIGPAAVFTNDRYPRSKNPNFKPIKTYLKKGCSIGANATIIAGVSIGKYAMVGAGAVVTESVPDYALVYGSPAVIRGFICRCGTKLKFKSNMSNCVCEKKYKLVHNKITLI